MISTISEGELHLYVDGHLGEERRHTVEAYLRRDPEMAARVGDYRRQNDLMRQLFAVASDAWASDAQRGLSLALEGRLARRSLGTRWRPMGAAAAGLILAGTLGAAGAALYDRNVTRPDAALPSFAETAARVHSFYADLPSEPTEFGADAAATLRLVLDKRLGEPLGLPDLSAKGFSLIGGRFLPAPDGAAAQLLYRDREGRLVTVFLGPADKAHFSTVPATEKAGLSLYAWHDGRIGVAVVGGLSGDELRGLAEAAQRSLLPAGGTARPDGPPGERNSRPQASPT
jgi:anti-sigma factor RsiW